MIYRKVQTLKFLTTEIFVVRINIGMKLTKFLETIVTTVATNINLDLLHKSLSRVYFSKKSKIIV